MIHHVEADAVSRTKLTLVIKDYDHIAPLAAGDVTVEGIDLDLVRDTENALDRTLADESIEVGELSFSRHLIRLADGDRSFVGIPVFPTHGFRHRCFYVLDDSDLHELADLAGIRIGTNEWPATGNTWTRAVIREAGVSIDDIDWWVGPVEDPDYPMRPHPELPDNVHWAADGRTLLGMLHDGDLDALMVPLPPAGLYDDGDPLVRLFPNYREEERAYYERTGIYPAHHIVGIRREAFERDPWIARSLYDALEESKQQWYSRCRRLNDTTPWLRAELEETTALLGEDWHPYGVEENRDVIETLCREEYEQGLIDEPLDPDTVFAEFEELTAGQD